VLFRSPTVFALVESLEKAQQVHDQIKAAIANPDLDLWVTKFSSTGIQLAIE